jgi:hypothetical protein
VPARDQAGEGEPDDAVLAHDDKVDVLFDAVEQLGRTPGLKRGLLRGRHFASV